MKESITIAHQFTFLLASLHDEFWHFQRSSVVNNYLRNNLQVFGLLQEVKYIGLSLVVLSRAILALHASAVKIPTSALETLRYRSGRHEKRR